MHTFIFKAVLKHLFSEMQEYTWWDICLLGHLPCCLWVYAIHYFPLFDTGPSSEPHSCGDQKLLRVVKYTSINNQFNIPINYCRMSLRNINQTDLSLLSFLSFLFHRLVRLQSSKEECQCWRSR